jgi:hypothetical protein
MLIVMPSDPTTKKASAFLTSRDIPNQVIDLPASIEYKTSANLALYLPGPANNQTMLLLSAQGFVIMRIFKTFRLEED